METYIYEHAPCQKIAKEFYYAYNATWKKLDDNLFNTARLIIYGLYIQVSIHNYLRALMGFYAYDTNFTLDPRVHETAAKTTTRGLGNQVTVEFNLLYRFHYAISARYERYAKDSMRDIFFIKDNKWDPEEYNSS